MAPPTVTILITVRNVRPTIEACLLGIFEQDYPGAYDVVVIDAESNDGTLDILKAFAQQHPNLRVVVKRSTQPEAYNYAIRAGLLAGEVVAMIDGDCVPAKDWLRCLVEELSKGWDAIGGVGLTPADVSPLARIVGYDLDYRFLATPEGQVPRHPNMNLAMWRSVLEKHQFDETLNVGYDFEFGYRLTEAGLRIGFSRRPRVDHYHRATLKAYGKQQYTTARFALKAYSRHPGRLKGDNINPSWMMAQPALFASTLLFAVLTLAFPPVVWLLLASGVAFCAVTILIAARIALKLRRWAAAFTLPLLYVYRLPFWFAGMARGALDLARARTVETVGPAAGR